MSSISSSLASLLTSSSSSSAIDLSSLLQVATGSSSEGINVTAAVNAAVTAARAPETQWKSQQTTLQSQESDLKTIKSAVETLEADLTSLSSATGALSSMSVSSSDTTVATASATTSATSGTHIIKVNNLATSSSWYSSFSVTDDSDGLAAGSFSIQLGNGSATQISIAQGETIDDLAAAINQISGASASVIQDANGYRISIVSNTSGADNNITIADTSAQLTKASDGSAWNSASFADSTGLSAGTTFSIQVGDGTATQITGQAGEMLDDLAADINARNLGVTATIVSDGDGYSHLALTNTSSNDATGVTISNASPQFLCATTGKNASLTIDGIPVSSATNTIAGVISGVTIKLNGTGSGKEVTLSASPNTGAITSAINQFVSDYNTVIGYLNTEFSYDASSSTAAPLAGDSTLSLLQSYLLGAGSYTCVNNGNTLSLATLGISMSNDGTLSVDSSTLANAIQSDFSSVKTFFQGSSLDGFSSVLNSQMESLTDSSTGAFTVDLSSMQSTYNALQDQINDFESNYIKNLQSRLTAEYNAAEIALQTLSTTRQQINAELGNDQSGN